MYPYDKLTKQFPWFNLYCECPNEWFNLIFIMLREIDDYYFDLGREVSIMPLQLKEKYDQLRFYYGIDEEDYSTNVYDDVQKIIDKYCEMSYTEIVESNLIKKEE